MDVVTLAALAEPNRLRIVELLDAAPRPVGEIAAALGLRQPQVTKHLQTLESAGLVRGHALGRRRVYSLRREPLHALREWASNIADTHPSEEALIRYEHAVAAETRRSPTDTSPRTARVRRTVSARRSTVWAAWTDSARARHWWSPQHLRVAECAIDAVPGGELRIVLEEGDGTRHRARGRFTELQPFQRLAFELTPEDADGRPMFRVAHTVRLESSGGRTVVMLRARATEAGPDAAPALAGLQIGWEQTLDKLAAYLS